ncbi:GNAT family N-acetyltransferase [Pedobacter sp. SYP-B3415]|uniref:GNAT family N-acetyltransferase n=1 Tax=Pedobacter sp. SYP-B3415 TaxID=2496641 RepID=UPI00101BDBA4|nr:GNAT family protein [Pedobacter sp. SYP-B3415]
MKVEIYLRPLQFADMELSYRWRNVPEIWTYTRFRPQHPITLAMERSWYANVSIRTDQVRFAICLLDDDRYIGNVQLINIGRNRAEFHMFIGDKACHGRGLGKRATALMMEIAFADMNLHLVTLDVHELNLAARRIYESQGFVKSGYAAPFIRMQAQRNTYTIS